MAHRVTRPRARRTRRGRGRTRGAVAARSPWQADDIDGVTWLDADAPAGAFVDVEVTGVVDDYDFSARVLSVVGAPAVQPRAASRRLPLASIGSFGR